MNEWKRSGQTEIVIGLVAATGANLDLAGKELAALLKHYQYDTVDVRLSELLTQIAWGDEGPEESPDRGSDRRIWELMALGTNFRESAERGDALSLVAVNEIVAERRRIAEANGEGNSADGGELGMSLPLERTAFVLRSLKHPDEVSLLRQVYGPRFFLIGAYVPEELRLENLAKGFADSGAGEDPEKWFKTPLELVERDEAESRPLGQQVRDTFHRADYFVDARDPIELRDQLERFLELLFGHPFRTPTRDEYAMFQAEGAALRSSEPGRQVGAALATADGSVIALGTNEVPKAKGGQYWDGDSLDSREFHRDVDTNRTQVREIAEEILRALREEGKSDHDAGGQRQVELERLLSTRLGDITEFGRAVHAEMSAILDAAIRGVSVLGSTAFTTTFPCHNCARHLIGAGIERVVYISPYPKSAALRLHDDAMTVDQDQCDSQMVRFEPFVGVAPRRYRQLFSQSFKDQNDYQRSRKSDSGHIFKFQSHKSTAQPLLVDIESPELMGKIAPYQDREHRAIRLLSDVWEKTGYQLKEGEDG